MDDIYQDLENYNDAEEIARLRSENQVLKSKIVDNGEEIKKLQQSILQDLDRITDEYHKLERNYSSLLKTARQEIERKTQTITNLNIDKDVMVLNYVGQHKNRNILRPKPYCNCPCVHNKFEKDVSKNVSERDKPKKMIEKDKSKKSLERENPKKSLGKEISSLTNCNPEVKSLEEKKQKEDKTMILKEIKTSEKPSSIPNVVLESKEETRETIPENINKPLIQKDKEEKRDTIPENKNKPLIQKDREEKRDIIPENKNKPLIQKDREEKRDTIPENKNKPSIQKDKEEKRDTILENKNKPLIQKDKEEKRDTVPENKNNPLIQKDREEKRNTILENKNKPLIQKNREEKRDTIPENKNMPLIQKDKEEKRDTIPENKNKPVLQKDNEIKVEKKPLSIRDRRKSMPILSEYPANFDSDDENDLNRLREKKRNCPSKDNNDKWLFNTNGNAKDKKTSKGHSSEEKSLYYHELSKPSHRSRHCTRWENERSLKDKYGNLRTRRYSPERHIRRENPYQKLEKKRTRVLVSPPYDKYDKYYSKKHRESRHYDRPQPYDFDRHRYYDDKPPKHKLPIDFGEPRRKRPKFEPQRRYPLDDKIRYDVEMESDSLAETLEQLESQYVSCQSPDYEQMEAMTVHPLKEIRETASSPLEDPRETSKRYIVRLNDKGNKVLTTVVGRNVDLKLINRENWCLPKVNIPKPVFNKPLQSDREIINDIYGDIDDVNLVSNISTKSCELQEPPNLGRPNTHENLELLQNISLDPKFSDEVKDRKQTENSTEVSLNKYRIPKIKKCDSKIIDVDSVNKNNSEDSPCIATEARINTEKSKVVSGKEESLIFMNTNNENVELRNNKSLDNDKLISHNIEYNVSVKGIVEGDLELSDETSDNTEVRHLIVNKTTEFVNNRMDYQEIVSNNTQSNTVEEKHEELKLTVPGKPRKTQNSPKNSRRVSPISVTLTRGKKKNKQKDIQQTESYSKPVQQEKKIRSKKDKDPKEMNTNKFKELFGTDSNSLMTPEDLGLTPKKVSSDKYVPFFEDAQDATDIEQIAKLKQDLMDIEKRLEPKNNEVGRKNNHSCVNIIEESNNLNVNRKFVNPNSLPDFKPLINLSFAENLNKSVNTVSVSSSQLLDNSASITNVTSISCTNTTHVPQVNPIFTCNDMPAINSITVTDCTPINRTVGITAATSVADLILINRTTSLTPATVTNPILTNRSAGATPAYVVTPTFKTRTEEKALVSGANSTLIDRTTSTIPAITTKPMENTAHTIPTFESNPIFTDRTTSLVPATVTNSILTNRIAGAAPTSVVNSMLKNANESVASVSVDNFTLIDRTICTARVFEPNPILLDRTTVSIPETVAIPKFPDNTIGLATTTAVKHTLIDRIGCAASATVANLTLMNTIVVNTPVTTVDQTPMGIPVPTSTVTSKTDYININQGKSTESDIVKTVIISSGLQPQCVESPTNASIQPLVVHVERLDDAMSNEFKYKNLNIETIKALATSTPYKEKSALEHGKVNDLINTSSNANKAGVVTEQSESSVSVSQNESDIPDVRIFVQRRRKIRKKPAS